MVDNEDNKHELNKNVKIYYYKNTEYYEPYIDLFYYISERYGHSILNVNRSYEYVKTIYDYLKSFNISYDNKYHVILHTSNVSNCNFNYYYKKFDRVLRINLKTNECNNYIIIFICEEKYKPKYKNFLLEYFQEKHIIGLLFCICVIMYHEYSLLKYFENNLELEFRPVDNSSRSFIYTTTYINTDRLRLFNIYSSRLRCTFAESYIYNKFNEMINLLNKNKIYG